MGDELKQEKYCSEFNNYTNKLIFDQEKYITDPVVRNHFKIPQNRKSVDAVLHTYECPYYLLEEKSATEIDKAIEKFETMETLMREQGLIVKQCAIVFTSLKEVRQLYRNMKGFLYSKVTKSNVLVNNRIPVELVQRKTRKRKKK